MSNSITINSLLSPLRELIYFKPISGGGDGGGGGLFNLVVSVLHKELEFKVEKFKYKKVGGHAAENQNQIRISNW